MEDNRRKARIWCTPLELLDDDLIPRHSIKPGQPAPWFRNFGSSSALLAARDEVHEVQENEDTQSVQPNFAQRSFSAIVALMRRSDDEEQEDEEEKEASHASRHHSSLWFNNFGSSRNLLQAVRKSLDFTSAQTVTDTTQSFATSFRFSLTEKVPASRRRSKTMRILPTLSFSFLTACMCGTQSEKDENLL